MSDKTPLEDIAAEPNWVEISPPKESDDEYTLGYFNNRDIRISSDEDIPDDDILELFSGPYKITLICEGESRMAFVERQRVEDQQRNNPTGKMAVYANQITLTLPDQIVNREDIKASDRFEADLAVEDGHIIIKFDQKGPLTVTVSESFNREQMDHEYEIRLGKVVGQTLSLDNTEKYCEWFPTDRGYDIETGIQIDTPEFTESEIRGRDPTKVFFEAGRGATQYSLTVDDDHPIADKILEQRGLGFRLAGFNGETIIKAVSESQPAGEEYSKPVIKKDEKRITFSLPEDVGDILRLYDRSWIRLYWDEEKDVLYGIPTETYGAAPILK